ncbi:hypothetical protein IAT40_005861 [Kwoniella sp. CBS 6097]
MALGRAEVSHAAANTSGPVHDVSPLGMALGFQDAPLALGWEGGGDTFNFLDNNVGWTDDFFRLFGRQQ